MARKSLGTLTLDLVADIGGYVGGLNKAERQSDKWKKKVTKDFKDAGRQLGVLVAAGAAGLAFLTTRAVQAAGEIEKLASVSNTSNQEFQRYAVGAKALGIEQEKLSDIFKDTSDRVGDFLQTGGGPLADFFENIAPKIGVTAEQFRNLSGPQALQLYVDSLQKANISQNEFTFFLEALSGDATKLIPLLKDGGRGFQLFAQEAEKAGAIMSDSTIDAAQRLNVSFELLQLSSKGFRGEITSAFIPVLDDLATTLFDVSTETNIASSVGDTLVVAFKGIASAAVTVGAVLNAVGKSIGGIAAIAQQGRIDYTNLFTNPIDELNRFGNAIMGVGDTYKIVAEDIAGDAKAAADLIANIFNAGTDDFEQTETGKKLDELRKILSSTRGELGSGAQFELVDPAALEAQQKAVESFVDGLQRQVDTFDATTEQTLRYEASLLKLNGTQQKTVDGLITEIGLLEERKKAAEAQTEVNEKATSIFEDLQTEEEAIRSSYEERKQIILEANNFEEEERQKLLERLAEQREEDLQNTSRQQEFDALIESLLTEEEAIQESYARRKEIILENTQENSEAQTALMVRLEQERNAQLAALDDARLAQAETLFGNLAGLAMAFAGEQSGVYRALFAVEKAVAIARSIVAIQTAIANAAASGPFPANLGAIASVTSATAGLVSTIASTNIQGVAHEGLDSVPTTGTYLLEQGERVTTEKTSAKLDRTLDKVNQGQSQGGGGNIRIVNSFDSSEVVGGYMGSSDGEKIIMNAVRRNQATIKSIVNA